MEAARILVAMGSETSDGKMRDLLAANGYTVIGHATDGNDCLRKIKSLRPDLAVLDYDLPALNGYEVSKIAAEDKLCDIILIVGRRQKDAAFFGDFSEEITILVKPLNRESFLNIVDVIIRNRQRIMNLEKQIEELKISLETRKEIEKAKGLLMEHLGLTEEKAFRRMQKQSMDKGIPMREIARSVIRIYGSAKQT